MDNPKLQLKGMVELKSVEEPYKRQGFRIGPTTTYYVVILAEIYDSKQHNLSNKPINMEVPVSKELYDNLKERMNAPKAGALKISGDLEVIAESVCN